MIVTDGKSISENWTMCGNENQDFFLFFIEI